MTTPGRQRVLSPHDLEAELSAWLDAADIDDRLTISVLVAPHPRRRGDPSDVSVDIAFFVLGARDEVVAQLTAAIAQDLTLGGIADDLVSHGATPYAIGDAVQGAMVEPTVRVRPR